MATSGKKGKKGKKSGKKGQQMGLNDFLNTGPPPPVSTQVKKSWADECDDDDDKPRIQIIDLPTAPRANRVFNDDNFPSSPPFVSYLSNLPYDLNEEDLYDFFENIVIKSIRLPKDEGDPNRLRGFGYIEFETRQDLIDAMSIPEPMIRNRRIRIELTCESDQKRNSRNNRNFDNNYRSEDSGSMTNWREGRAENSRPTDRSDQGGQRRNNYSRDNYRDKERPADSGNDGGNWRTENRPALPPASSPTSQRKPFGSSGFRRGGGIDENRMRENRREVPDIPRERPKIVLNPRTKPLPEFPKPAPEVEKEAEKEPEKEPEKEEEREEEVAAAEEKIEEENKPEPVKVPAVNIFGQAKPVDTAARERQIEMRLQEKEKLAREQKAREREQEEAEHQTEKGDPIKDDENIGKEENHEEHMEEKKPEEIVSWRVKTESSDGQNDADKRRNHSPARKYSPDRKYNSKRNDNRDLRDNNRGGGNNRDNRGGSNRDNRPRDYNNSGGDRDRYRDRDNRSYRDNRDRRDSNREAPPPLKEREINRAENKEVKTVEERMPKFHEPSGPNLSMTNKFAGLLPDDVED